MAIWYQTHITQGFKWTWQHPQGHSGIDLAEVNGTPLSAAVAGEVLHAGPHAWGGQVDILFTGGDGSPMVLSYLHLSQIARGIEPGVHVQAGQLIGLSGGATWSSPYPTQSKYSSGPHLHFELWVGDRAPYNDQSPWRPDEAHHPVDPSAFFYALKRSGIPNDQSTLGSILTSDAGVAGQNASTALSSSSANSSNGPNPDSASGDRAHALLVEFPGFYGIVSAIDAIEQFTPFAPPSAASLVPSANQNWWQIGIGLGGGVIGGAGVAAANAVTGQSPSGGAGYALDWFAHNVVAMLVRLLLILAGMSLIFGLIFALVRKSRMYQASGQFVGAVGNTVGGAAPAAALVAA